MINDKVYVGKTKHKLEYRIKDHLKEASSNSKLPFHRAIRKYGKDKFIWRILFESDNEKELNAKEIYYIHSKNCKTPNGYNVANGGQGVRGVPCKPKIKDHLRKVSIKNWKDPAYIEKHQKAMKRWTDNLTERDRQILSKSGKKNKGIAKPDGFGQKVRERMIGTVGNFTGRKHSKSTKLLMSVKALGKPKSESTKQKLSIINTGKTHSEESKNKNRIIAINQWKDPVFRDKMMKSKLKRKENK